MIAMSMSGPSAAPNESRPPPEVPPRVTRTPAAAPALHGPRVVRRGGQVDAPDWLEVHHVEAHGDAAREEWAESTTDAMDAWATGDGTRIDASEPLSLVVDPGLPEAPIRSPVTGRLVDAHDLAQQHQGASMPTLVRQDVLEARALLAADVSDPDALAVAVYLPGPVMTAPGHKPRKLCVRVALGVTPIEVVLRDADDPQAVPARLPFATIATLEVVNEGAQLSVGFADGRQVHLDLRDLKRRSVTTAAAVLAAIEGGLTEV